MKKQKSVKPAMKRAWFVKDGELSSGNESPRNRSKLWGDECRKLKLKPVQSFSSWNEWEGALALALDKNNNPVVLGGEPWVRHVTIPEAVRFLAEMCHESGDGEDGDSKATFFEIVAAQLEGSATKQPGEKLVTVDIELDADVNRYAEQRCRKEGIDLSKLVSQLIGRDRKAGAN